MLNFHGIPHRGAIFSVADAAFTAASNSQGQVAVALRMTANIQAAAVPGARLVAEAQELRKGNRAPFYQITIKTEGGDLIAICQAVVHRRKESLIGSSKRFRGRVPFFSVRWEIASIGLGSYPQSEIINRQGAKNAKTG